jgi:hypothetical protein
MYVLDYSSLTVEHWPRNEAVPGGKTLDWLEHSPRIEHVMPDSACDMYLNSRLLEIVGVYVYVLSMVIDEISDSR